MTSRRVLGELEAIAAHLGVAVRAEPFAMRVLAGRGGLCWVKGRPLVVMDVTMPVEDRIGVLLDALAQFDLDALHVPPLLRARIRANRPHAPRPTPRFARRHTGPGLARIRPELSSTK